MIEQDRQEKERMDSKNAVEEYVYEMRDKLSTELEPFIKEAVGCVLTSLKIIVYPALTCIISEPILIACGSIFSSRNKHIPCELCRSLG